MKVPVKATLALTLLSILLITPLQSFASGGSGGGGGGTASGSSILPSTPPAPDVILRESFGAAELLRPTGGKGTLKDVFLHKPIQGFWLEYPGSKDTAWLAPSEGQTWRFAACSDNPYEMPSPLQVTYGNGCVASEWFDPVVDIPTALMAFRPPATAYEISINGYPAPLPNAYLAVGLTSSSLLYSNLESSASVWLALKPNAAFDSTTVRYELRADGMNGPVLASGETYFEGFNQISLRYDPVSKTVSGSVNGVALGMHQLTIPTPKYAGFEGIGILDNFVVRPVS